MRYRAEVELPLPGYDNEIGDVVEIARQYGTPILVVEFEGPRAKADKARDDLNNELASLIFPTLSVFGRGRR